MHRHLLDTRWCYNKLWEFTFFSLAVQFLAPAWTVYFIIIIIIILKSLAIHPVWTILGNRKFSQRLSDLTWNTFSDISRSMEGTHLKWRNSGTSWLRSLRRRKRRERCSSSSVRKLNSSWSCSRRKYSGTATSPPLTTYRDNKTSKQTTALLNTRLSLVFSTVVLSSQILLFIMTKLHISVI